MGCCPRRQTLTTSDPKLRFALIHNGSEERLDVIRPRLAEVAEEFSSVVHEVFWQPLLSTAKYSLPRRMYTNRAFDRLHRRQVRFRSRREAKSTVRQFIGLVAGYLLWRSSVMPFHETIIEQALTDKHIRAWSMFLDSDADILIVLEDDAVIPHDTVPRVRALFRSELNASERPFYVELAGGFRLSELCPPEDLREVGPGLVRTRVPFGNTTCGYALSRALAAEMLTELTWKPRLRHIGPDWLVNELLMRIHVRTPVDCVHTEPTILGHGSFLGTHESHIQPRPAPKG
jgi:hypothetical protein